MRTNTEEHAWSDRRFAALAGILKWKINWVIGTMHCLWRACEKNDCAELSGNEIDVYADKKGFAKAAAEAGLMRAQNKGYYLCGMSERLIEIRSWKEKCSEGGKLGNKKRWGDHRVPDTNSEVNPTLPQSGSIASYVLGLKSSGSSLKEIKNSNAGGGGDPALAREAEQPPPPQSENDILNLRELWAESYEFIYRQKPRPMDQNQRNKISILLSISGSLEKARAVMQQYFLTKRKYYFSQSHSVDVLVADFDKVIPHAAHRFSRHA